MEQTEIVCQLVECNEKNTKYFFHIPATEVEPHSEEKDKLKLWDLLQSKSLNVKFIEV